MNDTAMSFDDKFKTLYKYKSIYIDLLRWLNLRLVERLFLLVN
jgi:hypothetical protein